MLTLDHLRTEARQLGFSACGAAQATEVGEWRVSQWRQWLHEGRHGGMDYLSRHADLRVDPRLVFEGTRTVVCVALNYFTVPMLSEEGYTLARYAYGKDYHEVMRHKLRLLMARLELIEGVDARPFCDTAPIDERYWAWRCRLGQWGRHAQFVLPQAGTHFFLGGLLLSADVAGAEPPAPNETAPDVRTICGGCYRCREACPSGALGQDGLDARRCLSYLTIEHRGPLPPATGRLMGRCFYGCDRCAEVCPHNRHASPTAEPSFYPSAELQAMSPDDWRSLTPERYRQLFKGSAVKRAKYEGLMRNIQALESEAEE